MLLLHLAVAPTPCQASGATGGWKHLEGGGGVQDMRDPTNGGGTEAEHVSSTVGNGSLGEMSAHEPAATQWLPGRAMLEQHTPAPQQHRLTPRDMQDPPFHGELVPEKLSQGSPMGATSQAPVFTHPAFHSPKVLP